MISDSRLVNLDILRGVAPLAVCFYHFRPGKRLEKVVGIPLLSPNIASELLAERLLASVIPANAADDAAHIALAAVHQMDFLLTWNCKHINNRFTIRRIEKACAEMGYQCPVISTPTELMTIEI